MSTVDFVELLDADGTDQSRFCYELYAILSCHGFVKVKNHSIPRDEIDRIFSLVRVKNLL